jgi:hypothetical protein
MTDGVEAGITGLGKTTYTGVVVAHAPVFRKWWDYAMDFVGSDILGAGAAMQVTYGVLPPGAYVAAGLVGSAYSALHW